MKSNLKTTYRAETHEGGVAFAHMTPEQSLRRSVLSCFLFEREFYECGQSIAERIAETARKVSPGVVSALAIEARTSFNLRHAPLYLTAVLAGMARGDDLVSRTLEKVIRRADEMPEFLAIYAKINGTTPDKLKGRISNQVKKGLARAFGKFDAYQLAKYDREGAIKLRDVMFLARPKPANDEQAAVWKKLADKNLESPDTWEVALSAGADKKATFERLIQEGNLGYLAVLRNLRNMNEAGVDHGLVRDVILARKGADRVLPFRFIAAARHAPWAEAWLDTAMQSSISALPTLPGKTVVLVDVSGSMDAPLSARSDMKRIDAACGLAAVINAESLRVFSFSDMIVEIPPRRGMAGVDAIRLSQPHGGTYLGAAVAHANKIGYDRLIVVTDEQSHDRVPEPVALGYMINVASAKNGIDYGPWVHIDGFSEQVLRFIYETETARD